MHLYSAIAFSITLSLRLLIINTYPSQRLRGWNGRWPSWRRAHQTPEIPTKTLVPERFLENSNLAPTNHGRICETLTLKELDLAPLTLARKITNIKQGGFDSNYRRRTRTDFRTEEVVLKVSFLNMLWKPMLRQNQGCFGIPLLDSIVLGWFIYVPLVVLSHS